MLEDGGLLVVEGRYFPISECHRWLNANHHRFVTHESGQMFLLRNGFNVLLSTTDPVCGSNTGRKGGGFVFGKKSSTNKPYLSLNSSNNADFLNLIKSRNLIKSPSEILSFVQSHDSQFSGGAV